MVGKAKPEADIVEDLQRFRLWSWRFALRFAAGAFVGNVVKMGVNCSSSASALLYRLIHVICGQYNTP